MKAWVVSWIQDPVEELTLFSTREKAYEHIMKYYERTNGLDGEDCAAIKKEYAKNLSYFCNDYIYAFEKTIDES